MLQTDLYPRGTSTIAFSKYIKPFRLLLSFDSADFILEDNTEEEANP